MKIIQKTPKVVYINTREITPSPYQPRREFELGALEELSQSIAENGVLQPLTVRKTDLGYELIAGERRLRASRLAGLSQVPCIVMTSSDEQSAVFAVLENLQREDLNFFEEAEGIATLIDKMGLTQEAVAQKLGKSQPSIANKLRILKLLPRQRELILKSGLSERHARALLKIEGNFERDNALSYIISKKLNVTQSEEYIDTLNFDKKYGTKKGERIVVIRDIRIFQNSISHAIEMMKKAGIKAQSLKTETDDFIEYTVKIPKIVKR